MKVFSVFAFKIMNNIVAKFSTNGNIRNQTKEVYTSSSEIELARQINISVRSDTLYFEISELDTYKDGKKRGLTALLKYTKANYEKVKEEIIKAEKLENTYVYKDVFERNYPKRFKQILCGTRGISFIGFL